MAKTSSVEKNEKRKRLVKQFAAKRKRLKAITQDKKLSMEERFTAQMTLSAMPRNSAKTRIRNRCDVTGRPRAYYRKLGMSRLALREFANNGLIPGMTKSSW